MADVMFNKGRQKIADNTINLTTGTIRVMLVTTGYSANANDDFVGDGAGANEISATNYSRKTLSNPSITEDDANNRALFDADDVTWSSLGGASNDTIAAAVIYNQVGGDDSTPADDQLICYLDLTDTTTNGSDVTLSFNSAGIIEF